MTGRRHGILQLARLYGVETSYEGMGGGVRRADPGALALTLRALGAELDGDGGVRHALRARRAELDALPIQPVQVAWNGTLPHLRIRLRSTGEQAASVELRLEDGDTAVLGTRATPLPRRAARGWTATHALEIGRRLPPGYHAARVGVGRETFETFVIAAPRRAWSPRSPTREWGLFFPLYAVGSRSSWGVGDYSDLARVSGWIRSLGGGFVSTLPLLATFLDAPFEPSPYSPASRLFWNELFLDVPRVPGWSGPTGDLQAEIEACRRGDVVDYRRIADLKRRELECALGHARRNTAVLTELRRYAAERPMALEYAAFRAVCDRLRAGWHAWPRRLREGTITEHDFDPADRDYHLFVQWQADRQLGEAARAGAQLYLDMPLGVNPDGFDNWRYPDLFADSMSAGAPPDPLFTGGQNWGFRPMVPGALRRSGYRYLADTLRQHFRHARMLRLDHVMSLYRLYWVPRGVDAGDGVYVRYPEDELFAVLVLESVRHQAVVVGEDLGTVPPAVRRAMDRHGVLRMHVLQFEVAPGSGPPPPPAASVASLNTHDMPTFAGFWRGTEIDDQLDLGLIDQAGHDAAMADRAALRNHLSRSVGGGGEIDAGVARQRLLERLSASPARYLLVNLEDLWMEDRPQNVPGTSFERPNWRRRARRSLEQIIDDAAIRRMLASMGERRQATPPSTTGHG
jgi:4-alpha-glucanotransferase